MFFRRDFMLKRYGYLFMAGLMVIAAGCSSGGSGNDTGTDQSLESSAPVSDADTGNGDSETPD